MQRRDFAKNLTLGAVAISTPGFIRFDGHRYVGDCETTTDILGPFYRPDSPVRYDLTVPGAPGDPIQLSGIIYHKDCISPFKNAKIELWHCSSEGIYDNISEEFLYRGTTFSDDHGKYFFNSILPVPYDIGGGNFRPAHFHMMISAAGYLPLVTQLYFTGDPHIAKDSSASSPNAVRRILDVQILRNGLKKVNYNVGMSDTLLLEPAAAEKLTGTYIHEKVKTNKVEFFQKNNILWMKNEVYGEQLDYLGKNTFRINGPNVTDGLSLLFQFMKKHAIKLTISYTDDNGQKQEEIFLKVK